MHSITINLAGLQIAFVRNFTTLAKHMIEFGLDIVPMEGGMVKLFTVDGSLYQELGYRAWNTESAAISDKSFEGKLDFQLHLQSTFGLLSHIGAEWQTYSGYFEVLTWVFHRHGDKVTVTVGGNIEALENLKGLISTQFRFLPMHLYARIK